MEPVMEARTSDTNETNETDEPQETNEADRERSAAVLRSESNAAEPVPAVTHREIAEWRGRDLIDSNGERIGRLEDVYFDVESDEAQFGTVKEGFLGRHLTFVPLTRAAIGPENLQVPVTKEQVKEAPNIEQQGGELSQVDESSLYHHYEFNYTPSDSQSGRRLARR